MKTKLTLSIDNEVIVQAKLFAEEKQTTLSALVEKYLSKVVETDSSKYQSSNLVDSIPAKEPSEPYDSLSDDEWLSKNLDIDS